MSITLFGCGKSKDNSDNNIGTSGTQGQQESKTADNSSTAQAKPSGVEWKEITYTTTDSDGYSFEVTYRLSPWILLSNTDTVNAVWAEVSNGNPMLGYDDWGLERYQNGMAYSNLVDNKGVNTSFYCEGMNDMYYCMGSVSIKNITEGWSLSENNKRNRSVCLSWSDEDIIGIQNPGSQLIVKVFLNGRTQKDGNGYLLHPVLTSDEWGPVPFIIMAPEVFTPNYPDGRYHDHWYSGHFSAGDSFFVIGNSGAFVNDIYIGIIGKDGKYLPPMSGE